MEIFAGDPSAGKQCQWKVATLMTNFFDKKQTNTRFKQQFGAIADCHMQLWPGQKVVPLPEEGEDFASKKKVALTVNTSVAFAAITHFMSASGRDRRLRFKTYELLKALIERSCEHNLKLDVLLCDLNGHAMRSSQDFANPTAGQLWTEEYRSARVALSWSAEMCSDKKPWVTSTSTKPHLADFIAYALDQVANMSKNPSLRKTKEELERCALSLLTQLAAFVDSNMTNITHRLKNIRMYTKRQRLATSAKWQFVADALKRLVDGEAG